MKNVRGEIPALGLAISAFQFWAKSRFGILVSSYRSKTHSSIRWTKGAAGLFFAVVNPEKDYILKPYSSKNLGIEIGFEVLDLEPCAAIPAHFHKKSDSIVACLETYNYPESKGLIRVRREITWKPLISGQILPIPKGEPHGFRAGNGQLRLLVVSYPKIDTKDTYFISE